MRKGSVTFFTAMLLLNFSSLLVIPAPWQDTGVYTLARDLINVPMQIAKKHLLGILH